MIRQRPLVRALSGGRLHLSHGPIDVVLRAWGRAAAVDTAYRAAAARFGEILPELCAELPLLRRPVQSTPAAPNATGFLSPLWGGDRRGGTPDIEAPAVPPTLSLPHEGGGDDGTRLSSNLDNRLLPQSPVARRMVAACQPFAEVFVTPMAAVAGAVADELMAVMRGAAELERAYVNDGGDIAVHCAPGAVLDIGVAGDFNRGPVPGLNGKLRIGHGDGIGGIATSGAHGRSFSLGIADSVTVLAADAATADVAATLIADAVDIDHPAVVRQPATELDPDSDLGSLPVTVSVGALPRQAVLAALEAGRRRAAGYRARGLIADAVLMLRGESASLFGDGAVNVGWVKRRMPKVSQGIGRSRTQKAGTTATEGTFP